MTAAALRSALGEGPRGPAIVVLQAGELHLGAFDPFAELIPIAHDAGAWVHIDGAFGLWAKASPSYRHLLEGVETADSWATDGHKWLNVPYESAYAFIADPMAHAKTMSWSAAYMPRVEGLRNPSVWNMEFSRRGRAIPTYAALRQLGRAGLADLVDRCCVMARRLVLGVGALPGAAVIWEPVINQGLIRFYDRRPGATEEDHDRRTAEVIKAIVDSGEAVFGGTTWRGMYVMRVSVTNWMTTARDVDRTIAAFARVLDAEDPLL
jgi:glutamate/tyrosine decarboxylase-like PLP-dependent enzyme